jgi:tetratricopeptide (TPR) repeat protein
MRNVLALLLGLVGGVAGGLGVRLLDPPAPTRASPAARRTEAHPDYEALLRRVEVLERPVADAPSPVTVEVPERSSPMPETAAGEEPDAQALPEDVREAVRALRGKPIGPREANAIFAWLAGHKEKIPEVIKALEEEVAAHPEDPHLRVALATAYVGELWFLTPNGPRQGAVWGKAAAQYDAAIELDPEHWQARFGKAFGTTFIPPQFGQQPYAIRQFEEILVLQERGGPEPHFVNTYRQLGSLYKDMGNAEKAREIWTRGLKLFPDDSHLRDALEVSTQR